MATITGVDAMQPIEPDKVTVHFSAPIDGLDFSAAQVLCDGDTLTPIDPAGPWTGTDVIFQNIGGDYEPSDAWSTASFPAGVPDSSGTLA